jgi:photosystem I P700 chlorophyll a apoprotein A2
LVTLQLFFFGQQVIYSTWQGNFEQWILNPLKVKPIAHGIWDPHFGETALKPLHEVELSCKYCIIRGLSMVVHNWYENESRFICCFGFLINCFVSLLQAGWLHLQPQFKPSIAWFKKTNHV